MYCSDVLFRHGCVCLDVSVCVLFGRWWCVSVVCTLMDVGGVCVCTLVYVSLGR